IHRDIKPHNIMVQPDGNAKVMDFGIARAGNSNMTQTGSVLGTAYYVSPEQAQGKPLTQATDIYSLGIVLYEAATGRVPFDAPDAVSVALKQVNEQPLPPRRINPDIDPAFEAIILRALQKNPVERYATADQMRTALNNYLAGRPINAGVPEPAAATRVIGAVGGAAAAGAGAAAGIGRIPANGTAVMPPLAGSQQPLTLSSSNRSRRDAQKEQAAKNKRTAIIVGAIAVLLVLIAALLIYLNVQGGSAEPTTVKVPSVIGATETEAERALLASKLKLGEVTLAASDTVAEGRVISQDPKEGETVEVDSKVNLTISSGKEPPKQVEVPPLRNLTPAAAEELLTSLNLKYSLGESKNDPEIAEGLICGQSVAAGTKVDEGTVIKYDVSKGKESTSITDYTGSDISEAEAALRNAGFEVSITEEYSSSVAADVVIRQTPSSGAGKSGDTIALVVSKGPEPVSVPDVSGYSYENAKSTLESYGFEVIRVLDVNSDDVPSGHVVSQDKKGDGYKKGERVTLTVSKGPATPPATTPPIP
ncbi:MAG: PASTA domain-containing protein, partial [Coriobacteriales bacterium]|nr:PASTA domain-containing protein [Coriobacteriales bacterium]